MPLFPTRKPSSGAHGTANPSRDRRGKGRSRPRSGLQYKTTLERLEDRVTPVVGFSEIPPIITPGTGFDGVVSINVSSCTGSLLRTGRDVLTAAHCFGFSTQTLTIQGNPTGGNFTLRFAGAGTGAIPFNATAAQIESALDGLATVNATTTTVVGLGGGQFDITIAASNDDNSTVALLAGATGLTGGANPAINILTSQSKDIAFDTVNNKSFTMDVDVVLNRTFTNAGTTVIEPDTTLFYPEEYVGRFDAVGALGIDTDFDLAIVGLPKVAPIEADRYNIFTGNSDIIDSDTGMPYANDNLPIGMIVGYGRIGTSTSDARPQSGGVKHFGYNEVEAGDEGGRTDNVLETLNFNDDLGPTESILGNGDSGGPLFLRGLLAGIASKGGDTSSTWTRVSTYADTIDDWLDLTGPFATTPRDVDVELDMDFQGAGRDGVSDLISVTRIIDSSEGTDRVSIFVNGRLATRVDFANMTSLTLKGSNDGDTFILSGDIDFPVTIDGGRGFDDLVIRRSGGNDNATYVPGGTTGSGAITIGSHDIDFSDLEPITISNLASFTLDTSGTTVASVEKVDAAKNRVSGTEDGVEFESVKFFEVTTFIIDTGDNGDTITAQTPLVAEGLRNFTVRTRGENDTLTLGSDFSLPTAGGAFTYDAGTGTDFLTAAGDANFTLTNAALTSVDSFTNAANGTLALAGLENARLTGGDSANTITAVGFTGGAVTISGLGGNDVLTGGSGNETITGGRGNDTITGGPGADQMFGEEDSDTLIWNPGDGNDVMEGGAGEDVLRFNGAAGVDTFVMTAVGVRLRFDRQPGSIVIDAGDIEQVDANALGGADSVTVNDLTGTSVRVVNIDLGPADAAADSVTVLGRALPDAITVSGAAGLAVEGASVKVVIANSTAANDRLTIQGVGGDDTLKSTASAEALIGITLDGGDGDDVLSADAILLGGPGDDLFFPLAGVNTIDGGAGFDQIIVNGNDGNNAINVSQAAAVVTVNVDGQISTNTTTNVERIAVSGFAGQDGITLAGLLIPAFVDAGIGNDTVSAVGVTVALVILGGDGNDSLTAGSGADRIQGGPGNDTLIGGPGNDEMFGEADSDTLVWNPGDGNDLDEGGTGEDRLVFNGAAGVDTFVLSANGTRLRFDRQPGNIVIDAADIEQVDANALGGADIITVNNLEGTGVRRVNLDLGPADAAADRVTLEGRNTGEDIALNVVAGAVLVEGLAAIVQISNSFAAACPPLPTDDLLTLNGNGGNDTIVAADGVENRIGMVINGNAGNDFIEADATIFGGIGDDTLIGGECDNLIDGGAGNDNISGKDGNDTLLGQDGDDVISGGNGNDTISGHAGNDRITGDDGDDVISGGLGNDIISGGIGVDTITGDDGDDIINGNDDDDTISGGLGDDVISGGAGDDTIFGDDGNDTITGDAGADTIRGGLGNDTISGGDDNDAIFGDEGDDVLNGDAGEDTIEGGLGADVISGGTGADLLFGQEDNDHINGDDGDDYLDGGDGDDVMSGGRGNDALLGRAGSDTLTGDDGNDKLFGGDDNDVISGGNGNDTICGELGDDTVSGDAGSDVVLGGEGNDQVFGNDGDDYLFGGLGNDRIEGGAGNDYAFGGVNVLLVGATDNDTILGGDGNDFLYGQAGNDVITGGFGNDRIVGGNGNDRLHGGNGVFRQPHAHPPVGPSDGDDVLMGEDGNDLLDGGNGFNTQDAGDDLYREIILGGTGPDIAYIHGNRGTGRHGLSDEAGLDGGHNVYVHRGSLVTAPPPNEPDCDSAMLDPSNIDAFVISGPALVQGLGKPTSTVPLHVLPPGVNAVVVRGPVPRTKPVAKPVTVKPPISTPAKPRPAQVLWNPRTRSLGFARR